MVFEIHPSAKLVVDNGMRLEYKILLSAGPVKDCRILELDSNFGQVSPP
jgi:hypothetical protein